MYLPQELVDMVIDHLHDDCESLKSCSLVCKAWTPSSQLHLFITMSLSRQVDIFMCARQFSLLPIPAKFIKELCLGNNSGWTKWNLNAHIFGYLRSFPYVRSLTICNLCLIHPLAFGHCLGAFQELRSLTLRYFTCQESADLARLIDMFPCLEDLRIDGLDCAELSVSHNLIVNVSSPLRGRLEISQCSSDCAGWIVNGLAQLSPNFTSMRIDFIDVSDFDSWNNLFSSCALTLETLEIRYVAESRGERYMGATCLSLKENIALRRLVISLDAWSWVAFPWLGPFLSSIRSPFLSQITFISTDFQDAPSADSWKDIEHRLFCLCNEYRLRLVIDFNLEDRNLETLVSQEQEVIISGDRVLCNSLSLTEVAGKVCRRRQPFSP